MDVVRHYDQHTIPRIGLQRHTAEDGLVSLGCVLFYIRGPGSSVSIATDYGLDGPGSDPGRDEIFRPSRPALGPTQSPVQWVSGLSREYSAARACC